MPKFRASPVVPAAVLGLCLSVAFAQDGREDQVRRGPHASPVSWVDGGEAPPSVVGALERATRDLLGAEAESLHVLRSEVTDGGWLGSSRPMDVWRVNVSPVPVARIRPPGGSPIQPESRGVAVSLAFDAVSLEFLFACTRPRDEWVLPARPDAVQRLPEQIDDWCPTVEGVAGRRVEMSLREVLGRLWGYRLDPSVAGLTILRLRWAVCRFPPRPMEEGGGDNDVGYVYWMCESHGVLVEPPGSSAPYMSGQILAINDACPDTTLHFLVE